MRNLIILYAIVGLTFNSATVYLEAHYVVTNSEDNRLQYNNYFNPEIESSLSNIYSESAATNLINDDDDELKTVLADDPTPLDHDDYKTDATRSVQHLTQSLAATPTPEVTTNEATKSVNAELYTTPEATTERILTPAADFDPCAEVTHLSVENVTATRMKSAVILSWDDPNVNSRCITHYRIRYQQKRQYDDSRSTELDFGGPGITNITLTSDFMPLEPCLPYNVQIFVNGDETGAGATISIYNRATITENIGPVRGLNVTVVGNSASITWNKPNDEDCIEFYGVQLFDNDEQIFNDNITETQIVFGGDLLEHCVSYRVVVVAYEFEVGWGDVNERTFRTDVTKPTQVQNFMWESNSTTTPVPATTVTATWTRPVNGSRCVQHHVVKMWRKSDPSDIAYEDSRVTGMTVSVADLDACEIYVMEVIPMINDTIVGISDRFEMEMAAREPIAPTPLRSNGSTSVSLTLVTTSEDTKIVCQLYLVKFVCTPVTEEQKSLGCRLGSKRSSPSNNETCNFNVFDKFEKQEPITNEMDEYKTTIDKLEPWTIYNCAAQLKNEKGWSALVYGLNFRTSEAAPGQPKKVEVTDIRATSFKAVWEPPVKENGRITTYYVFVIMVGLLYPVPRNGCPRIDDGEHQYTTSDTVFEYRVDNLMPHASYSVQVAAATSKGVGDYSETQRIQTLDAASEPVRSFHNDIKQPESVEVYDASVTFSWLLPCRTNGELKGYKLDMYGTRPDYDDHHFIKEINGNGSEEVSVEVTEILPFYQYNATVLPVTNYNRNRETFMIFRTPPSVPKANDIIDWGTANVKESSTINKNNPTKNAEVLIAESVLKSDAGDIEYVAILLSERGCQPDPEPQNAVSFEWPDTKTWNEASRQVCIPQYQTTPIRWKPVKANRNRGLPHNTAVFIQYVVGTEDCSPSADVNVYCNGPLKPGTSYAVILRVFTDSGYSDTQPIYFKTDSLVAVLLIVVSISVLLMLSFIIGVFILYRSGALRKSNDNLITFTEPNDISTKGFIAHFSEVTSNKNEKLIREYKTLEVALVEDNQMNAGKFNMSKNRYNNVQPYDKNRVVLKNGTSDYINASYIRGYRDKENEYIATQGPTERTCADFWRMVYEQGVDSIVMLTSFVEGEKNKCAEYFPKYKQFSDYDDIQVECKQELSFTNYKKRILYVSVQNEEIQVTHYHFLKWMDHDCPRTPEDLIKFVKIVRNERKNISNPLVVHCSAGVGRTGTFIALDILMQMIKQEKRLNIYEVVKHLRIQRMKMVQTLGQYVFLYKCVYEIISKEKDWKQRLKDKLTNDKNKDADQVIEADEKINNNAVVILVNSNSNGNSSKHQPPPTQSYLPSDLESNI